MSFLIPPFDPSLTWISVDRAAIIWSRSPRLIRRWCFDGTFVSMGARVYKDGYRWFIGVPHSEIPPQSEQAVLSCL